MKIYNLRLFIAFIHSSWLITHFDIKTFQFSIKQKQKRNIFIIVFI